MLLLFAYSDFMLPPCWVAGPELMLEMGDGRWEGGVQAKISGLAWLWKAQGLVVTSSKSETCASALRVYRPLTPY